MSGEVILMWCAASYAAGVLSMAVWHGVHVFLSNKPTWIISENEPWDNVDSVCCAHNVQHCAICQEIRNRLQG